MWQRDSIHGMTLVYDRYGNGSSYAALAGGRFWITGIPGRNGWQRDQGYVEPIVYAINPKIKNILFIGLGTGSELLIFRDLFPDAKVTVVEINPDLIDAFNELAYVPIKENLENSKIFLGDGRRFLQSHIDDKFDYIHIGVHRASTSGTGNLFSKDFLKKLRDHLTPGGVVTFYGYPPVVKGALDVFGDVAVFTKNGSIGITYCTAEEDYIIRDGFSQRYSVARERVGSFLSPGKRPYWLPGESVVYPKAALAALLEGILPATDDHLVTEYYLTNRTELIPGAHQGNRPMDYRIWPFSDGAIPFPGSVTMGQDFQNARREIRTVKGGIEQLLKSGTTTAPFLPVGNVAMASLTDLGTNPSRSYQWDFPIVKPGDTNKETYWRYHATCDKRGRGLWGVKAYFADKDGWKTPNIQSASRGENRLSLTFSTPPGVEGVHFAVTFDNAPGIGSATKLGCSEFLIAEYR